MKSLPHKKYRHRSNYLKGNQSWLLHQPALTLLRITAMIVSLCIYLPYDGFSQATNAISSRGISAVTVKTFDARKKDTTERKTFTRYDHHGNVLESIDYDATGKIKSQEQFEYNRHDDETAYRLLDADGKIQKSVITIYDKWNHVASKTTMDSTGAIAEKTVSNYNAFNDLVSESTFGKDGTLIRHVLYNYDTKGMLLSRKVYNEKGELIYAKEYTYEY